MKSSKKNKEISKLNYETELHSVDAVSEVLEDDMNSSILDFITNKLAQNLEMKINISKNKNTDKLGLSFSVKYDDENK